MTPLTLTLPFACLVSVNTRTNPVRGRQVLTRKYRAGLTHADALVAAQVRGEPVAHEVEVTMRFWTPDKRRRDCGNYVKLVEDSLTGRVYQDDSQIKRLTWEDCGTDRANPRVEVTVTDYMSEAA